MYTPIKSKSISYLQTHTGTYNISISTLVEFVQETFGKGNSLLVSQI